MFAQPQPSSSAVGDADNNKPDTTSSTMRRHTSKADMLKLQLTVLSFDKLQLAYPVYVDDEEKEVEEDDYNEYINAQYDRIISAHVGVSSPYFYQTIQPSPTSSTSTSLTVQCSLPVRGMNCHSPPTTRNQLHSMTTRKEQKKWVLPSIGEMPRPIGQKQNIPAS